MPTKYIFVEKKKKKKISIIFGYIALDKALFSSKRYLYFSYFSMKTYVVGTH